LAIFCISESPDGSNDSEIEDFLKSQARLLLPERSRQYN